MRGRIYDPELGRFTTADPFVQSPFSSQGFNRYAYVFNNPLRYTDPSGFLQDSDPTHVETSGKGDAYTVEFSDANIQGKAPQNAPSEGADKPNQAAPGAEGGKGSGATTPPGEKEQQGGGGPGTGGGGGPQKGTGPNGPGPGPLTVPQGAAGANYNASRAYNTAVQEGRGRDGSAPSGPVHLTDSPSLLGMAAREFVLGLIEPFENTANAVGPEDEAIRSQTGAEFAIGVAAAMSAPGAKILGALGSTTNAEVRAIETAAQTAAKVPSTAFGRSIKSLRDTLNTGKGPWKLFTAHAEGSTSKVYGPSATSIEEVFVHEVTGERIVRHTVVEGDQVLHETFRPHAKFE